MTQPENVFQQPAERARDLVLPRRATPRQRTARQPSGCIIKVLNRRDLRRIELGSAQQRFRVLTVALCRSSPKGGFVLPTQAVTESQKSAFDQPQLDQLCINTIRCLAMDAVQKANSGHPGLPMGAAPMAYVLWDRFLRHHPRKPRWPNRDRFVLSAGHGCMLLYSLLHLTGYDLTLDDIKNFRQWGSKTPGHPEHLLVEGIETTTGPLGQGFGNGVGMAIARLYLGTYFNRPGHEILDYKIYALVSDGDLMEGVASEAASLAGHLGLSPLIYIYDNNHISIEGPTELAFTEDRGKRFEAYGWFVEY